MATIQTIHNEHYGTITTGLHELMVAHHVSRHSTRTLPGMLVK